MNLPLTTLFTIFFASTTAITHNQYTNSSSGMGSAENSFSVLVPSPLINQYTNSSLGMGSAENSFSVLVASPLINQYTNSSLGMGSAENSFSVLVPSPLINQYTNPADKPPFRLSSLEEMKNFNASILV